GELHAGRAEVEAENGVATHGADTAVEVADGDAEEEAADKTENGVTEILVQRGHGSGFELAAEAVAHNEIVALFEFGEETGELAEVVACIGISHEDVLPACRLDAGKQCRTIAADRDRNDASAF